MPVIHKLNALPIKERKSIKLYKKPTVPQQNINYDKPNNMFAGEHYNKKALIIFAIVDKLAPILCKRNKLGKILSSFFENRLRNAITEK
jgi:hypothetical protein